MFPLVAFLAGNVCPHWPSAAEAEVTACSHGPLSHNAHHCLNITAMFRKTQNGRSNRVSRDACMFINVYVCVCLFLYLCALISVHVCISCWCVQLLSGSLVQSSHCLVTAGRRAVRKGRDFWSESISLTPEKLYFPFFAKSKNIRERTFLCLADVAGEVGSVWAGTGDRGTT